MASIYRPAAKRTQRSGMILDGIEPARLRSINSGVASQDVNPQAPVKHFFQSKSSIIDHLPTLPTLISLCLLFFKQDLRQLLL
jgi:hypothetical protein